MTIVNRPMYQQRGHQDAADESKVELTSRDRDDVVRLLSLLLGQDEVEERRRDVSLVRLAESILSDRRRRSEIFNPAMFGEPAWELLLTLFVMDRQGPRLTIGALAQAAGAKLTTALRWLEYLEDQDFVRREPHPNDMRTAFIELTDKAREALRLYLSGTSTPNL